MAITAPKKDIETKQQIESGLQDPDVQDAIQVMAKNAIVHARHEGVWRAIQQLFENTFFVQDPTGTKRISSKLLLQVCWTVWNKLKIPDFKIYRSGPFQFIADKKQRDQEKATREFAENVVTAGVSTVMKEGGFLQCMKDKGGAFWNITLMGDSHIMVGYDPDNSDYPIRFKVSSLSDTYLNQSAVDLRSPIGGLSVGDKVDIFRYTMKEFDSMFPDFKGKVAKGEVPRQLRYRKQLEKTWIQTVYDPEDMIEVAYYTSINRTHVVFAGSACTIIQKLKGEKGKVPEDADGEFPYEMDGKPFLPMLHFKFIPSSEGYYNYGVGHMLYDIAVLTAKMDEMAYNHAGDNIYPIVFVNSAQKNTSKLFNDIMQASALRETGTRPYVVSDNMNGSSGVTLESFQSQPITQEWERAFTRLEQQVTRLGFRIDAPDLGANPNEMSIMANQESADAPIKQVIEFNASEFEMAVKITMEFIRKFVDDDDMTPLNSMVDLETGDSEKIGLRDIPLGWVAKELRANKYFVVVNSRDGTIPSNVMELARAKEVMQITPPGTPAWNKQFLTIAKLNGQNFKEEDLSPPQQAQAQGMPQSPGGAENAAPIPTETTPLNAYTLKHGQQ